MGLAYSSALGWLISGAEAISVQLVVPSTYATHHPQGTEIRQRRPSDLKGGVLGVARAKR